METYAAILLSIGVAIAAIGYVGLLITAFRVRILWGVACLFLPPVALVFLFCHWPRTKPATLIILIGGLIAVLPFAINSAYEWYIRGKPIDAVVDNEQHVTITGWASKDYSYLANKVNAVVVQMANPDVTDETLQFLRAMTKLRELDVSSTQVSDEGLKLLAELPALQDLRLMNTKITDEGFQSHLAAKDSLLRLDLRGTKVATKTLREWKTKREGREYLK